MAYVIMHQHYGIYLGSNQNTAYWSFVCNADLPPAAQTFPSIEDATSHVTSWRYGNIPSAYSYVTIEDHGSGYVFDHEAMAQGLPDWSHKRTNHPHGSLAASA